MMTDNFETLISEHNEYVATAIERLKDHKVSEILPEIMIKPEDNVGQITANLQTAADLAKVEDIKFDRETPVRELDEGWGTSLDVRGHYKPKLKPASERLETFIKLAAEANLSQLDILESPSASIDPGKTEPAVELSQEPKK